MGCRDGDTVCIDIGETRGDGVWEKRISVETGVGGCDILTVDYMVRKYRRYVGIQKKLFQNAGKFRRYGVLYGNSKEG